MGTTFIMTLMKAREIAVKVRCDPRSVLRAWREGPDAVRGVLGEAIEIELAPLRAASKPSGAASQSETPGP